MKLSRLGGHLISVAGKDWEVRFGEPDRDRFTVKCADDLFLVSGTCTINELLEQSALPSRLRPHISEDGKEFSFDSKAVIPFGSEPSVIRKYRLTENVLQITTDIVMRTSPGMEFLSAGDFQIRGKIVKVVVVESDGTVRESKADIVCDGPTPPLSVLFQSESGAWVELSAGEDVWRWCGAERIGGKSSFRIEREKNGFRFIRELFRREQMDGPPPPGRTWRFNTLIAWRTSSSSPRRPSVPKAVFDCDAEPWSDSLRKESGEVCFSAKGTVNILKKWLRSCLNDLRDGDILLLDNVRIGPCRSASHQDRPGRKELFHWDLQALLEFKRWAEKQLGRSGAVLRIIPAKDSPLKILPSILAR